MATTTTSYQQHQHQKSHLPPSPPPSPPASRRRHKKRSDSFEKLANTPLPSPPTSSSQDPFATKDDEPLLTRIILTPIIAISFILSLSYVNIRDRANRTYAHSSSTSSLLSYLWPSTWLDPEPYQDPADSTWARGAPSAGHVEPHDAISPRDRSEQVDGAGGVDKKSKKHRKRESWHLNKKIRKVAKLEVSDALEMRGRVMLGMCVAVMVCFGIVFFGVKWGLSILLARWR